MVTWFYSLVLLILLTFLPAFLLSQLYFHPQVSCSSQFPKYVNDKLSEAQFDFDMMNISHDSR